MSNEETIIAKLDDIGERIARIERNQSLYESIRLTNLMAMIEALVATDAMQRSAAIAMFRGLERDFREASQYPNPSPSANEFAKVCAEFTELLILRP